MIIHREGLMVDNLFFWTLSNDARVLRYPIFHNQIHRKDDKYDTTSLT
jgi:hypothetical protein